ncbi:hypothetical protein [Streptomyces sp. NBC_01264]|uniref:hypothetical protein n=1 Tax=Streptomyces sp. NBC_01264 TaxID=2903804 RepID=UPI00225459EC|nr:hypothetical protein [Streptomyces sp. NBC_01264]MCX4783300.1 hypothetical protein [Streptomyces sp. NBC_01264]
MVRATGRRARRGATSPEQTPAAPRTGVTRSAPVAIVVATPGEAVPLIASEPDGSAIEVVCLDGGSDAEYRALEAAVAEARRRGCRFSGDPYVLDAGVGSITGQILDVFHETGPVRVRTLDPDPTHVGYDKERKLPVVTEPPARGQVARSALRAARRYQRAVGVPVFVDCRAAGTDPGLVSEAGPRYPEPSRWLVSGKDGRLSAYLPTAAGVVRWTEGRTEAEGWSGPELLEGPDLMPGLTVVQGSDGYAYLIGLSRTDRKEGGADIEVVYAAQYQTGRPLGPWVSLGNPHTSWQVARSIGFPAATFAADGFMHVFVRNFGRGISVRKQSPKGVLSSWEALRGRKVADETAVFASPDGSVHLVARTRDGDGAVHWYHGNAAAGWQENRGIPVNPRPGSLSAAPDSGMVRFRYAATNEVCVWWPGAHAPIGLGGPDGDGPVTGVVGADIQGWGCTVLVRGGHGGVPAIGAYPDGRPDTGVWWSPSGERSIVPPAAAFDGQGRVVIVTVGMDGRLRVARQQLGSDGLEFTPWHAQ